MERKIDRILEEWKVSKGRLPLIVQGARQVGKTFSLLDFGHRCFINTIYLNFERSRELQTVFERDLDPHRILRELSVITGETIMKEKSLIIFDEIQTCARALTSLKYFAEEAPDYVVVAAGSLPGVTVNRNKYSFPVGKVNIIHMYPLDFEECLWANDRRNAAEIIRENYMANSSCSIHDTLNDIYRTFLFIGGMPQVVDDYVVNKDLLRVSMLQKNINDTYVADMARYADPAETVRIISVFQSIPSQLAKENHKFQYKVIKSGARAAIYGSAIDWLKASGIVTACHKVSSGTIPLTAVADSESFKLYHIDTGLLCNMAGVSMKSVISELEGSNRFSGALAENYVATTLTAAGHNPFYWESEGKSEVDFVIQAENRIIPIEVKSSGNVRSKSLNEFVRRYSPSLSYRISTKNFGLENNIKSIPLYAVFCV